MSFYSNMMKMQFSIKMIICRFLRLIKRFENNTSVHYQAISHTGNQNLQFFLRSMKLHKVTKNWLQRFTKSRKRDFYNSFKTIKGSRVYVLIHWWSFWNLKEVFFQFQKLFLILVTKNTQISKRGVKVALVVASTIFFWLCSSLLTARFLTQSS